jgi:hypothetical protein
MNSLAAFKRRLEVGKKLHTIHHGYGKETDQEVDLGTREISIVQSNSFALKTKRVGGEEVDSWCYYPKSSDCRFPDKNTIEMWEPAYNDEVNDRSYKAYKSLTYKFID